ncbi:hypothetical protein P280DRAFT_467153 [Massarina eburnea CBS 473.64]|uniref:DUF1772-domain-containing protein n=1 Tax=Massarina eburnea CBS 473.64 TaxID=1395130 RepID=A0A6A6S8J8_9PLEO|nr:hypothetical protein P280DRAFT_467153 [Massarina eburnea CBS 473.64]
MADKSFRVPAAICAAQMVGITAPAIYSSLTFAYSYMVVPPLIDHSPEKLLARQWLQAYQYASTFVPPLIVTGTLSNVFLAVRAPTIVQKIPYAAAALCTFSIIPWTLLVFEPTINGAGKWKVQRLLHGEKGWQDLPLQEGKLPSTTTHTATSEARRWSKGKTMKYIAAEWAYMNAQRYLVTAIAVGFSMVGTYMWLSGPSFFQNLPRFFKSSPSLAKQVKSAKSLFF